jgi:large subunit ribosomal protein L23
MTDYFDVLRRPLITEKTNYQSGKLHQYVFEVRADASKTLVKDAVEHLFDVTVMRVNVINVPAKRKRNLRNRRTSQRRGSYRKAIVTLAPGDSIPVFEGVR